MLEIRVLNEDDVVNIYNYEDKQALIKEYFSDSINADIPSNDNIVVSVNNHHVNGIDFDTLMKIIALD